MMCDVEFWRGVVFGMLLGAGVTGHVLRVITAEDEQRRLIGGAGALLYGLAAVLVACGAIAGYVVAIVGPMVGLTAVLLSKERVDTFQLVLGVAQVVTALISGYLLALLWSGVA